MIKRADRWLDDGLSIIGVFQSPQSAVGEFMRDRGMLFPFVGDPTERLYAEWGLSAGLGGLMAPRLAGPMAMSVISGRVFQKHGSLLRIPADFLIEADGTIAETFYGKDIGDHIPFERVDAFVASRL